MIFEIGIGELSRQSGASIKKIRYYEEIELLPKAARTISGHRRYHKIHHERLSFILQAKELGFSIKQIKELIRLSVNQNASCTQVKNVAQAHLIIVRERISDLKRLERILKDTITECDKGYKTECPVIQALAHKRTG